MSTKTKVSDTKKAWEVTFVACNLDTATKQQLANWDPKFTSTIDGLDRMVSDGYKISISNDKMHDAVGVYATMPDKSHKHNGFCLSSRGPGMMAALKALVFKHFTVLQQDWQVEVQQVDEWSSWG
jgi:hypothetical protein